MEKWLALLPKPLGLFLSNDALVHQSLLACQNIGLAVPSDVAILGVDNLEIECDLVRPSLSSIIHPSQQIGQAAAKLIDQLMQGKKPHQRTYLIPSPGIASRTSTDVYQYGDQDVGDAMRFIREQAHQPITVQEILAKVPISRSRLERRFQEILGTTPLRQIQIAHIDRAKILLTHTDLPLSTIAERCGMRYSSQLSQLFKKITGMTPKTYRIQQRQIEF
jgi:LacI family transcriptional regulator